MRQSQLRRITGTIAYRMAEIFGFQKQHATPGGVVLSSVANQVHHAAFTPIPNLNPNPNPNSNPNPNPNPIPNPNPNPKQDSDWAPYKPCTTGWCAGHSSIFWPASIINAQQRHTFAKP